MTLAEIKRRVQPGQVYDITNHYITRPDHPSYGTTRRFVVRTTQARIYMSLVAAGSRQAARPARSTGRRRPRCRWTTTARSACTAAAGRPQTTCG
jgi:hypothetical protein